MLTNNNLHIVIIGYKTKTEVKQAVRKKINKKRYLYPLTVSCPVESQSRWSLQSSVFSRGDLPAKAAATAATVNQEYYFTLLNLRLKTGPGSHMWSLWSRVTYVSVTDLSVLHLSQCTPAPDFTWALIAVLYNTAQLSNSVSFMTKYIL